MFLVPCPNGFIHGRASRWHPCGEHTCQRPGKHTQCRHRKGRKGWYRNSLGPMGMDEARWPQIPWFITSFPWIAMQIRGETGLSQHEIRYIRYTCNGSLGIYFWSQGSPSQLDEILYTAETGNNFFTQYATSLPVRLTILVGVLSPIFLSNSNFSRFISPPLDRTMPRP